MKEHELDTPWLCMARADTCDYEATKAMADTGLCAIKFGVESGVQRVVNATGKSLDLAKVKDAVKWCQDFGVRVHCTFTIGLPTETWDDMMQTIDFALKLDPDSAQFSINTPFPGTKYFALLDKLGYVLEKDWEKYDGTCKSVIRTEHLSPEDLQRAQGLARKRWDRHLIGKKMLQPAYIKQAMLNPGYALRRVAEVI